MNHKLKDTVMVNFMEEFELVRVRLLVFIVAVRNHNFILTLCCKFENFSLIGKRFQSMRKTFL